MRGAACADELKQSASLALARQSVVGLKSERAIA
jgi:hypothetical protein